MSAMPGTYGMKKKDGTRYYKASITWKGKHISLGSYFSETKAHQAYLLAAKLLGPKPEPPEPFKALQVEDYMEYGTALAFEKWVMVLNMRDSGIYCRNPIYLYKKYFIYYLDADTPLKFDVDDLFYYMKRKIMRRGGHLFVAEYGMQVNILSRYGIKNYAVEGRDYNFVNGDKLDFRYGNIEVINRYYGVQRRVCEGKLRFQVKIHMNGDTIVGTYNTEAEAAIAYNKAAGLLKERGFCREFSINYVEDISEIEYARIYNQVRISRKIREFQMKENSRGANRRLQEDESL